MKFLILITLAAMVQATPEAPLNSYPVVQSDGFLRETPDVAAARAAHQNEHSRAQSLVIPPGGFTSVRYVSDFAPPGSALTSEGGLADTHDVARAKAIHYRELAAAQGLSTAVYDDYLASIGA